jgi:hypothetical protein
VFVWDTALWMTATSYQVYRSGKAHIVLASLDEGTITSVVPLQCPDMNDDQHHWTPWVHQSKLHFVYRIVPWTVLRLDDRATGATTVVVQTPCLAWGDVIPATSPVPYKDGYLMVVALRNDEERFFYRYLRLSKALVPTHYSSSWVLWAPDKERIHGLTIQEDYVYLAYATEQQKECRVTRFTLPLMDKAVSWYNV